MRAATETVNPSYLQALFKASHGGHLTPHNITQTLSEVADSPLTQEGPSLLRAKRQW